MGQVGVIGSCVCTFFKFCGLKPIVSSCGLYHGAGYTLIYFSKSDIFVAVRVICHAGYRPENTVAYDTPTSKCSCLSTILKIKAILAK